jgi:hypothetical protein
MRRRDFLRAALAGTVAPYLAGLPSVLEGPDEPNPFKALARQVGPAYRGRLFEEGQPARSVWFRRVYGSTVEAGSRSMRMRLDPKTGVWIPEASEGP